MSDIAHLSSCAVHNMPAYPAGPCDCGAINMTALARELAEALRGIGESLDTIEAQERYDNDPDSFTEDLIEVARAATTKARAAGLVP